MRRFCLVLVLISLPLLAEAQQREEGRPDSVEGLRKELLFLRAQLDSLRSAQLQFESNQDEATNRFEDRLDKRLQELEGKIDAIARSSAPIIFNPSTTAFINFAARADNRPVLDEAETAEIHNRPFLRSIEFDYRAPVDPYAEAIAIVSLEDEAGSGFAVDAEEVYGLIKKLPILEDAPLGLKLKVGKFRAPFGTSNKLHMHDLPWTTRPLVVSKYLGTEHGEFFESGFNPVGADLDFYFPNPIPGTTLEMNLDVLRSGSLGLTQERSGKQPAYLGRLNLSADWKNEHILVLGASAYRERGKTSTTLLGADVTYKWSPAQRRDSRSFVAGGELFVGKHTYDDPEAGETTINPVGGFAYLQYQLSYWLYLGVRYDWVQEPTNAQLSTKAFAAYASYYTTEFLRFRIGFERRLSDLPAHNNLNTGLLEINFVFGSHPTEPYWVNR